MNNDEKYINKLDNLSQSFWETILIKKYFS